MRVSLNKLAEMSLQLEQGWVLHIKSNKKDTPVSS